jgi:signal transduction histidine kinase
VPDGSSPSTPSAPPSATPPEAADEAELRRLKWIAVIAPLLFLAGLEAARSGLGPALPGVWPTSLLLGGAALLGVLFFAEAVFRVVGRMQARQARQTRELLALHEAGLAIAAQFDPDAVLQTVVDEARDLAGARYGALLALDEAGGVGAFYTSGITAEQRAAMGEVPVRHGLVGVVFDEGKPLRVPDIARDPRAVGLPPGHPPMRALLAAPIEARATLGALFVAERNDGGAFTAEDEATLVRFATQAALAIENARLHARVRALAATEERERIAREMHDSLAQVLGYVNTKAQAVELLLRSGHAEKAVGQLAQLSGAARDAYAEVREGILGLRASPAPGRPFADLLAEYLDRWREQSGITATLAVDPEPFAPRLDPFAEVQLLRIVQEALANVRKHAGAGSARVALAARDGWLEATIADDGAGIAQTPREGDQPRFGLAIMRERAEAAGGQFAIESPPTGGTVVRVRVPLDRRRPPAAPG